MNQNIFRWAVSEELLPPSAYQGLRAVASLKLGRSAARETPRVPPVPEPHIEAVQPFVSRQVWGMIQLQFRTGARPGDVALLRLIDIDTSMAVWQYRPQTHKTEHHGHERTVYLGPDAQEVLREFMDRPVSSYVFSPREAEAERLEVLHAERKTPLSHGNRPGTNRKRKPRRVPGEHYTTDSYRRAIQRACDKAEIPRWHPHQLRHNAATKLRAAFGIEASRILLGVRSLDVAAIYAERDQKQAMAIAQEMG
jgi:integrase